ncbi:hypothetical protein Lfu02_32180 [Longispora fulva]|uniref:Uncharacterized protein n=1 Tax=Longispora fulva TaxID=619741 RepID=A0A8J7GVH9_9ACTN|nr:hypothetical protein [Longispora fulva]MBG6139349.1 hypothetical protein [Longispora fulva]GIG58846.1 hypothetical protein Lfu02_32180 [Longispora fulva]
MGRYDNLDVDDIQRIMSYEHAQPNAAHSVAWFRLTQILDQHRANLKVYTDRLAAHWDPATNVAAAAFLSHIDDLRAALDASAQVTMTNSNALTDLAGHITTTQQQLERIAKLHEVHKAEDKELINTINPWYDARAPQDDAHARTALEEFDRASFDTYMRMQLPPEYIPPAPGEFDPNDPGTDTGWQPLSPIAPLVTPVPSHSGVIAGPVTQPWPTQPAGPAPGGPVVAGSAGGPVIQGGAPVTPTAVTPGPPLPGGPTPPGPSGLPALPGTPPINGLPTNPGGSASAGPKRLGLLDNLPTRRSVSPVVGGATTETTTTRPPLRSRPPGTVPSMLGETSRPPAPARPVEPPGRGLSARPNRGGVIGQPADDSSGGSRTGARHGGVADRAEYRYSGVYEDDFRDRRTAPAVIAGPGDPRPVEPGPTRPVPPVEHPVEPGPTGPVPPAERPAGVSPVIGAPGPGPAAGPGPVFGTSGSVRPVTSGGAMGAPDSELSAASPVLPFPTIGAPVASPGSTDPGPTVGGPPGAPSP